MDTTNERVHIIENMTWDELVAQETKMRAVLNGNDRTDEMSNLRAERDNLRAENDELKAQLKAQLKKTEKELKETKIDLQDKEISFSAVMAILKYYLDFFEALNPSQKALGNAMKKMKNRIESNNKA